MPKALIPNHMFFDNDDEPYTVLRTIRVGLEMQGFTVEEDPSAFLLMAHTAIRKRMLLPPVQNLTRLASCLHHMS